MEEKSVLIVILNYKTYEMTLDLVSQLKKIKYKNYQIMVIDNNSNNGSKEELERHKDGNYIFYPNSVNSGYAAGNNIGIKYAVDNNFDYTWILNNDVKIINEDCLNILIGSFVDDKIASVGPKIIDLDGNICSPYVKRPSVWNMTLGVVSYKNNRDKFQNTSGFVYRLHGCCMILNNKVMKKVDYFDERTFLYCEEEILAEKFISMGYVSFYNPKVEVLHMESSTVNKEFSKKNKQKNNIYFNSLDLYMKDYRKYNVITRFFIKTVKKLLLFIKS